jgi:MFS family permease
MRSTSIAVRGNLAVLLLAIFLIASAEELWARFLPAYLRALGASVTLVAAFGTFKDFLDAVYQFPGGLLTNRLGYRRALIAFNGAALIGYASFAIARTWSVIFAGLPFMMAWQSFSLPATFSLIGDSLPAGARSLAFAWQSIVRRIPIVIAPVAGGIILTRFGTVLGMRIAIACGIVLAFGALLLQSVSYKVAPAAGERLHIRELLADASKLSRRLKRLLVCDVIVRFGQGVGEIFIVLYALRVVGVSPATFGWLVGLAMATSIAVYLPVARYADARGREPWVLITYIFFAAFPLLLAVSNSPLLLALAFVAMGLREIGEPPRKAMIVDSARTDRRSVDVGAYYLVRGFAVFPASLVGGVLWKIAPAMTFYAAAAICGLGAVTFAVLLLQRAVADTSEPEMGKKRQL